MPGTAGMMPAHAALHVAEIAEAKIPVAQAHVVNAAVAVGPSLGLINVMVKQPVGTVPEAAYAVVFLLIALAA